MTRMLVKTLVFTAIVVAAIMGTHGKAYAGCSVNGPISDLVAAYNPFSAPQTITVAANTMGVTCSSENGVAVKVFVSGSSTGYATPFLTGPSSFNLSYTMCVPGTSPCNATTNVWNTTTGFYSFTTQSNMGSHIYNVPSFQIFVTQQDAPFGTTAQYTGNLFFTTTCAGVAC